MNVGTKDRPVRFSFVQVWEPKAMDEGSAPKYGIQVIIPKSDTQTIAAVEKAIAAAKSDGIKKGMWTEAATKNPAFKGCLRDGDQEAAERGDGSRDYLKGCMFFNANAAADRQPAVVDRFLKPIMRRDDFYSGCYGIAEVNFYPFKFGKGGIGAGLNSIMKREDGERLDGRMSPDQAFAADADEEGTEASEGQLV